MSINFPQVSALRPSTANNPVIPAPVSQPPAVNLPKETFVQKLEEEAADALIFVGKVPFLHTLGIKLYGLFSKPKPSQPALSNLGALTPDLLRGAQPSTTGFERLAGQGVKTVINLRPEYNDEGPVVQKNGMKYIYMPLPPLGAPSIQQGLKFLSTVTDPANGKVFFHCQHGADRTGAMAAAYRIAVQGWTADQAISEMGQYKFHLGAEDEKLVFVRKFAQYWAGLSAAEKATILHQQASLNMKG